MTEPPDWKREQNETKSNGAIERRVDETVDHQNGRYADEKQRRAEGQPRLVLGFRGEDEEGCASECVVEPRGGSKV